MFIRSGEDDTDGDEENSDDSGTHSVPVEREPRERIMKKPVTLDVNGVPWGNMKECLADDVKKYAKSLDATANWESQTSAARSQLFKRMYKGNRTDYSDNAASFSNVNFFARLV